MYNIWLLAIRAKFYDRFLENYSGVKIGLTYKECICDKMDSEINDIKMNKVIF